MKVHKIVTSGYRKGNYDDIVRNLRGWVRGIEQEPNTIKVTAHIEEANFNIWTGVQTWKTTITTWKDLDYAYSKTRNPNYNPKDYRWKLEQEGVFDE